MAASSHRGTVVDLDGSPAREAAELSAGTGHAMADSLTVAVSRSVDATR